MANARENRRSMTAERPVLLRFVLLYCALFGAFGCVSPFLPAFLAGRGLGPEELGVVLGGATALRLVCGPIAGRIARTWLLRHSGRKRHDGLPRS
jgi:MFS family permease